VYVPLATADAAYGPSSASEMALMVSVAETAIGPLYWVEEKVGVEPLVV
jgi:hypothetical protein